MALYEIYDQKMVVLALTEGRLSSFLTSKRHPPDTCISPSEELAVLAKMAFKFLKSKLGYANYYNPRVRGLS
jgi:hypothetical protein